MYKAGDIVWVEKDDKNPLAHPGFKAFFGIVSEPEIIKKSLGGWSYFNEGKPPIVLFTMSGYFVPVYFAEPNEIKRLATKEEALKRYRSATEDLVDKLVETLDPNVLMDRHWEKIKEKEEDAINRFDVGDKVYCKFYPNKTTQKNIKEWCEFSGTSSENFGIALGKSWVYAKTVVLGKEDGKYVVRNALSENPDATLKVIPSRLAINPEKKKIWNPNEREEA